MPQTTLSPAPSQLRVPSRGRLTGVRVRDFRRSAWVGPTDRIRRADVVLQRTPDGDVAVLARTGALLGFLPTSWVRSVDFDLWTAERRGATAVARAYLGGTREESDLFVLLGWTGR